MNPDTVQISRYTMSCFCCDSPIIKGSCITRVIENTGIQLRSRGNRRPTYTNARWVHAWCLPKYEYTEHFYDVLKDRLDNLDDSEDPDEAEQELRDHKYWRDEK